MKGSSFLLGLLLSFVGGPAGADSIFALNGLGEPLSGADTRAWGMGGASIAVGEGFSVVNPAAVRASERASLAVEVSPGFLQTRGPDASLVREGFSLDLAHLLFPQANGNTLSLSLHPEASFNTPRVETSLEADSLAYKRSVQATGNLSAVGVGYSVDWRRWSFGVRGDYLFGSANEDWLVSFSADTLFHDSSGRAVPVRDQVDTWSTSFLGAQAAVGLLYRGPLSVGAVLTLSPWAEGEQSFEGLSSEAGDVQHFDYDLPPKLGLGAAWFASESLIFAVDGEWSGWSRFRVNGVEVEEMQDVTRISGGMEWHLGSAGGFLSTRFPLRLGGAYGALPHRLARTGGGWDSVQATRFTLGTGTHFAHERGAINMAFEYIYRSNGDIDEREYRFHLSISALERWARKI